VGSRDGKKDEGMWMKDGVLERRCIAVVEIDLDVRNCVGEDFLDRVTLNDLVDVGVGFFDWVGVDDGEGEGEGVDVGVGVLDRVGVNEGVVEGEGVDVGVGVFERVGVNEGKGEDVEVGVGVFERVGLDEGVGEGVEVGVGVLDRVRETAGVREEGLVCKGTGDLECVRVRVGGFDEYFSEFDGPRVWVGKVGPDGVPKGVLNFLVVVVVNARVYEGEKEEEEEDDESEG